MAKNKESDMVCQNCKEEREALKETPRTLVMLPGVGTQKKTKMYACPHCDGPVVELATREAS